MDRFVSLALFVAAVDEGSLAAAGRRFGFSAAVAGKHVSSLESDMRVRLLQRTTRRLTLTEAGQAFLPRCRRILNEYDEGRREASDQQRLVHGALRVAAPTEFGVTRLGEMLARFANDHPAVRIELRLDDRYVDLVENEIDVAVRIGRLTDSNLVTRRLGECRLVLCASPQFVARHGVPRTPADLAGLPRLAFSQSVSVGDWTFIAPDGNVHVVDGRVAVSANNVQLLAAVATRDGGLVYGPDFVFAASIAAGGLVPLMTEWGTPTLDIHAVFPALRHIPHKVRLFVDYLVQQLSDR